MYYAITGENKYLIIENDENVRVPPKYIKISTIIINIFMANIFTVHTHTHTADI